MRIIKTMYNKKKIVSMWCNLNHINSKEFNISKIIRQKISLKNYNKITINLNITDDKTRIFYHKKYFAKTLKSYFITPSISNDKHQQSIVLNSSPVEILDIYSNMTLFMYNSFFKKYSINYNIFFIKNLNFFSIKINNKRFIEITSA